MKTFKKDGVKNQISQMITYYNHYHWIPKDIRNCFPDVYTSQWKEQTFCRINLCSVIQRFLRINIQNTVFHSLPFFPLNKIYLSNNEKKNVGGNIKTSKLILSYSSWQLVSRWDMILTQCFIRNVISNTNHS